MFHNFRYKLLALGLAIIFWAFVVSLKNAIIEFPTLIPIQVLNLGDKLAVSEMPEGVRLTLRAENADVFRTLQPSDFDVSIDLSNVGVGSRKVPVTVNVKNPKVEMLRVDPEEVPLTIELVREKILPIHASWQGKVANGFEVATISADAASVSLSGADSILAQVDWVEAVVMLDGTEQKPFSRKTTLAVFDAARKEVAGVKLTPGEVNVSVDLVQKEREKQVGVKPVIAGKLASGFIKSLSVEPSLVTISGDTALVDKISVMETEAISLDELTVSTQKKVKLKLPAGVKALEGDLVLVNIEIGKTEVEKTEPTP